MWEFLQSVPMRSPLGLSIVLAAHAVFFGTLFLPLWGPWFVRSLRAFFLVVRDPSARALARTLEAEKREHRASRLEVEATKALCAKVLDEKGQEILEVCRLRKELSAEMSRTGTLTAERNEAIREGAEDNNLLCAILDIPEVAAVEVEGRSEVEDVREALDVAKRGGSFTYGVSQPGGYIEIRHNGVAVHREPLYELVTARGAMRQLEDALFAVTRERDEARSAEAIRTQQVEAMREERDEARESVAQARADGYRMFLRGQLLRGQRAPNEPEKPVSFPVGTRVRAKLCKMHAARPGSQPCPADLADVLTVTGPEDPCGVTPVSGPYGPCLWLSCCLERYENSNECAWHWFRNGHCEYCGARDEPNHDAK